MMNATQGSDPRHTAELEREGDEIRADMGRTLDQLERKFSPEQVMDRSMNFLRENGSTLVQEIGETVRNHPLPVLLTAAGLIWLTGSITQSRPKQSSANHAKTYRGSTDPASPRDGTNAFTSSTVRGRLSSSMRAVREREQRVATSIATLVQDQPLALGALAVAAGALIGAALPMTSYENELLTGTRNDATPRENDAESRSNGASAQESSAKDEPGVEASEAYVAPSAP